MKKLTTTILAIVFIFFGLLQINAQTKNEWLRPPAQLNGPSLTDNPNVELTWWNPETPTWLYYGDGSVRGYVTFNTGHYEVATKYDATDLVSYHGMSIKKIDFIGSAEAHPFTLKIWTGSDGDFVEYEQIIDTVVTDNWTSVVLNTPFVIDSSQTFFIGLSFDIESDGEKGIVIDEGPAAEGGVGSLIRNSEGVFVSLTEYGIDNNWSIAIYLELDSSTKKQNIFNFDQQKNVCNTGVLSVVDIKNVEKLDTRISQAKSPTSFNIYRDNDVVGTSVEPSYTDVLTSGGSYIYSVSAVYPEGESDKSASIEIVFDNNRVPYNTVISETFINVGEANGILNSPSSPGPFMGIKELEYEVDNIAPIIYHSGTQILGFDPFSTIDIEERFMYYMAVTFSFPMTLFNAGYFQGGGGSESMYEVYKPLYESALTMLTPLAFESNLEKVSNTKYMLNATIKKVGIYSDSNTVLHVVLTQETLDYTWNLGELDQVKFVATGMFPNFEGTTLEFVGDSVATASVELEIDPFLPKSNYKVIAFVQSVDGYLILNGDILSIPVNKSVEFTVVNREYDPVEGAAISTNGETKVTDAEGNVNFYILSNMGELEYTVSNDGFDEATGYFNMDTAKTVLVELIRTDINSHVQIKSQVYPNPTNSNVNIVADINSNVQIMNSVGVVVYEYKQQQYSQSIDLSVYENGIYFISLNSNTDNKVFRIVKID